MPKLALWLLFGIFVQKLLETNHNFRYNQLRNQKNNEGSIVVSTFKTDIIRVHLFSQSFYSFASKIEICFKDFFGHKITKATIVHSQKQANLAWVR